MDDPLWLSAAEMQATGHLTVDRLAAHLADPRSHPLVTAVDAASLSQALADPPPEEPLPFDGSLHTLFAQVVSNASRTEHPGYFAFIPSCQTWIGALGDLIASGTNMFAGSWLDGAGPTQLELTVIEWFRTWLGMPVTAGGILTTGGSAANMTAIACAREVLAGPMNDRLVLYVGDQAHSSIARGARSLGFRPDRVRVLPSDAGLRMSPAALADAIDRDRAAGLEPLLVVAVAGTTNTGVVDPLAEIAEVCRAEGVWLHVDAAYGGFAALTERGRGELEGIGEADSITVDPHKWLYQPFECGAVLVKEASMLERAFLIAPDYLHDTHDDEQGPNLADRGLQLTRMSRAVKVWLTVRTFGLAAIRSAIDRCFDLAAYAEQRIANDPRLELLHPRALSIVCFRRRVPGDEDEAERVNAALVASLEASGDALVSSTRLGGRYAVRLCVLNHTSERRDVDGVLKHFAEAGVPARPPRMARRPAASSSWLVDGGTGIDDDLARVPAFATLGPEAAARLRSSANIVRVPAGSVVVAQGEGSSDFFVVLDGRVTVSRDGRALDTIEAGGSFGELAAWDWGAGYGYARLATVTAATDTRLLRIPAFTFRHLVEIDGAFASHARATMAERLPSVRPGSP